MLTPYVSLTTCCAVFASISSPTVFEQPVQLHQAADFIEGHDGGEEGEIAEIEPPF